MHTTALERALQSFPYGLYVVGSTKDATIRTIVVNWATQVSFYPPLVAIAIEDDSQMRDLIQQSGIFSLNVLPTGSTETARAFMKATAPEGNTVNGHEFRLSSHGAPFLNGASVSIECKVVNSFPTGDHITFIGEVVEAVTHKDGDALTLKETGWRYQRPAKKKIT